MDLNTILKKTKQKSDSIQRNRESVYIATAERPYELDASEMSRHDPTEHIEKLETNRRQTGDKLETKNREPETNWRQTGDKSGDKSGDKLETNWRQTGDKLETKNREPETNWRQTGDQSGDKTGDKLETNWRQTGDKLETNLEKKLNKLPLPSFSSLIGIQKYITLFIYDNCKISPTKISLPITIKHISECCNIPYFSIKKTIQRLSDKSILHRVESKNGRGGWATYKLNEIVYQQILHIDLHTDSVKNWRQTGDKLETNWRQTGDKLGGKLETKLETNAPSSSSNYKITTTTNPGQDCSISEQADSPWDLDIASLEKIGFTQHHLSQLAKRKSLESHLVQESIYAFAHDLENHAVHINSSPLNFFMGILNKGQPYVSRSPQYETPKEKAMRLFLERETRLKQQAQEIEMTLMQKARSEWFTNMSFEEQVAKAKEAHLELEAGKEASTPYRSSQMIATLEKYFEIFIWPALKPSIYQKEGFSALLA